MKDWVRSYNGFFVALILALSLAGCASFGGSPVETPEQALASAQLEYKGLLENALLWQEEGRFEGEKGAETEKKLAGFFDEFEKAYNAAAIAVDLKNKDLFEVNNANMIRLLRELRGILQ